MASHPYHYDYGLPNGDPNRTPAASAPPYPPAALLNPRGSNGLIGPQNGLHNPYFNSSGSSTPVEYSFDSPETRYTADLPIHYPANNLSHPNAFGTMIERMNNVEHRTLVPPQNKRRKLELGESFESKPNFEAGGSGMLGQHLREIREQHERPGSAVELVDLTSGNDEGDVVEIQPIEEEVCYGMVQDARLNCHLCPSPKPGAISIMGDGHWPFVKIVLRRKAGDETQRIYAYDHTRKVIGLVDPRTASGLAPLLDAPRLQMRTNCRINSRRKEPGEEAGQAISRAYVLDMVLYGPRKAAMTVGKYLSQKGIWLRKPFVYDNGIKYENPQEFEGPRPPPPSVFRQQPPAYAPSPLLVRSVEEIRSEVMGVFDSLTKSEDLPEMEPHPRVQTELLRHQRQGLYFMTTKEQPRVFAANGKTPDSFWQSQYSPQGQRLYRNVITGQVQDRKPPETFGGILADMMGLGKTLSILSLVATTLEEAETWLSEEPVQPQAPPSKNKGESSRQFHIPAPPPLDLTPLKQNGRATLLVCPLSTITNWEEQIRLHIKPGQMRYYIYHGSNRIKDASVLADYDMVLTTYGSVASEVNARNKGKPGPWPLEEIGWFRIVLDEAHMIREQTTLQFKAICRLQAHRRWAVTGTPVQNKLDDLAALLAFLRLKPFDEKGKFTQFITSPFKMCDPEIVPKLRVLVDSVTLRRLKDKINLPPRTDQLVKLEFSPNERKLYQLFEQNAQDKVQVLAAGRERMVGGKVYIHILQSILRLRLICAHGRDLLNEADLDLVQGMTADSAIDIDSDEEDTKPAIAEARSYEAFALMEETNNDLCISCKRRLGSNDAADIASEREEDVIGHMTACFHLLCPNCIKAWKQETKDRDHGSCLFCGSDIRFQCNELRKSKLEVEHESHHTEAKAGPKIGHDGYSGPHTKTKALVEDLLKSEAESNANPDEPPYKSVVFSAWTSHLNLIEMALNTAGIRFTRLDGRMTRPSRSAAMTAFREEPSIHVMLVSISAGGLGLNLVTGNTVYMMEPQYNPAAEAQAIDRVHRLGQKRPVRTVRYIMQNSIEEKMLILQDKKMKLASLSMDRNRQMDKAEAAKQKLMDLRDLFK